MVKKAAINKTILKFLAIVSLVPNIGLKFKFLGITWTLYRISVIFLFFIFLFGQQLKLKAAKETIYRQWIYYMAAWIIYGILLWLLSPYVIPKTGLLELLSLVYGAAVMLIFLLAGADAKTVRSLFNITYLLLNGFILIGLFEIHTGYHFASSIYNDTANDVIEVFHISRHMASGFMYNVNDFSAFITCLLPVCLYDKKWKYVKWLTAAGVLYINYRNDAAICSLSVLLCILGYFLLLKDCGKIMQYIRRLLIGAVIAVLICLIWMCRTQVLAGSGIFTTISQQFANARLGFGSYFSRKTMYIDIVKAAVRTWFVGTGPGSFSNYFTKYKSMSKLVNPHSLLFEILLEYGLLILLIFIGLIFKMAADACRRYKRDRENEHRHKFLAAAVLLIMYLCISFAPSSFLGYAYQWLVIALAALTIYGERTI